jgi:hypothetical protein
MTELSIERMEMIEAGRVSWKCLLGIVAVVAGAALAVTGVGIAAAGGSIGGGLGLINSQC